MQPRRSIMIMGVSGSGKSTIGRALADALQLPFLEADDLHSAHNVAKMRAGQPLTDTDRWPWLMQIARALQDRGRYPRGVVVACSALKRVYRDRLRQSVGSLQFVFLDVPQTVATQRVRSRPQHYMPPSLVPSQFAALERPAAAETDTLSVSADAPVPAVLAAVRHALGS